MGRGEFQKIQGDNKPVHYYTIGHRSINLSFLPYDFATSSSWLLIFFLGKSPKIIHFNRIPIKPVFSGADTEVPPATPPY